MTDQHELRAIATEIIGANHYMTLATADAEGRPWASPVYYAAEGVNEFFWVSCLDATHSLNLAERPDVSIVIFRSEAPVGAGQGVYMRAKAEELSGAGLERGIAVFSRESVPAGVGAWEVVDDQGGVAPATEEPAETRPPALHRLYRATALEHSVLDPGGHPLHGHRRDHRTPVTF